jgi:molecular chaperone GrpE
VTDRANTPEGAEAMVGSEEFEPTTAEADTVAEQDAVAAQAPSGETVAPEPAASASAAAGATTDADAGQDLAAERLADLQRLQAEYVNYKRRVDRDRAVVQERAVHSVLEAVLPVLDDIHAAREHGDLADGPFAAIADKLEGLLGKFGLERYGAAGEEFDPNLHEALMHTPWPADGSLAAAESTTVVQVLQPGYRAGEQVLRAARVAVADPE